MTLGMLGSVNDGIAQAEAQLSATNAMMAKATQPV